MDTSDRPIFVTTTVSAAEEADRLENLLLEEKLVACVQRIDINSAYWWKGRVEREPEILLLMKTAGSLENAVIERIEENHSYELPEIVTFPVSGGLADYLNWIEATCRTKTDRK
jgi:periplasmic divalent cation tolerance protein